MMHRKRPSQILLLSLTILALFVSSVSACACSHHQVAAIEEKVACHTSPHGSATNAKTSALAGDQIGVDCECIVRTSVPGISAQSDNKSYQQVDNADSLIETEFAGLNLIIFEARALDPLHSSANHHSPPELFSGPSRAPPRL